MAKRDQYHPDYKGLYPNEDISPAIMTALKRSDRKMEYMEVDLKQGPYQQDSAEFTRCREDSLERLIQEEGMEFAAPGPSPEEIAIRHDEVERIRKALLLLEPEEYALIWALFFEGLTIRAYAKRMGCPTMTIYNRKAQIQKKLKKLLEN